MRIAWFTHRYHPCTGGSEEYGRQVIRRLVAAGHAVDVFTSNALDLWYFNDRKRKSVPGPLEEWVDGARVVRFPVRHLPFQRYATRLLSHWPNWETRCRYASFMPLIPGLESVRGEYDVVCSLGFPYTVFSLAAWKTAVAVGAPLVLTPFLHLSTPGDPVNRAYTRPHQVELLRRAQAVVVQTCVEGQTVLNWGIDPDRVLQLGMAVDHAAVCGGDRASARRRLGIPSHARVIGQLGALDPNKGTVDLIQAVARLNADRHASDPVQLVLAGASSPAFERYLAELAPQSRRWVRMLGSIPDAQRPDFYAMLDLFAMPSRTDSFGIVFLEAWANALPVVAAAAGGVVDVVTHETTGLLVPFGDPDRLAQALGRLIENPALARSLGQAGWRKVQQPRYHWDDRARILERLYTRLSRGRTQRRTEGPEPMPRSPGPTRRFLNYTTRQSRRSTRDRAV